jgi:hypothetical protein
MATELGTLSDLVTAIETVIKPAIEEEEKRLLEKKTLLQEIYEQVIGDFSEKAATDLAYTYSLSLMKDLSPDLYVAITTE